MALRIGPEECARRILQRELARPVILHDDGSEPRMYDLRVGDQSRPELAIECTGAVDQRRTETWNVGPARGSFILPVEGDWHVVMHPAATVKRIDAELQSLLRECIAFGVQGHTPVERLRFVHRSLFDRLVALKIESVSRYDPGAGRVSYGMTGLGGAVDRTGMDMARWVADFLRAPERQDVLIKLRASHAIERHVFIPVSFGGVPWLVESYLGTQTELLPQESPDLPDPVDAVWIMYGRRGLRWDKAGWRFFDALVPALAESK